MIFIELKKIDEMVPIEELNDVQLKELQYALIELDYKVGEVDGTLGPRLRNAWAEFKIDEYPGNPNLIGPESIAKLESLLDDNSSDITKYEKYDLSTKESVISAIISECKKEGLDLNNQIAYVLATAEWESGQTFKPVREAPWKSEAWRKSNFRYYPYYGRGLVQLTWLTNYKKYSKLTGKDLVKNPDLVLDPHLSLYILVHGMKTGTFTGRKVSDFINHNKTDFIGARRIINGNDKASSIAKLANKYLKLLNSNQLN